jgi:hypothetical protein
MPTFVVDFDNASWRCGYAHQLGQALLHNNIVSCLWLDPLAFLSKENSNFYSEGAGKLSCSDVGVFQDQLCFALRTIRG